jgi:Zn-dependent peptidase ImmA (M78 family)
MNTVQAIARALGVKLQILFMPVHELKNVRFRSNRQIQNRENILADVSRWLDDFNFLESELKERIDFKLRGVRDQCSRDDIISCAKECRKILKIKDDDPIHDICGLLEHAGIKIYPLAMSSDGFFGLSVREGDGGPAIIVNTWDRITVERRIFTAAHELGHLILHTLAYDVKQSAENNEEEHEADLFGGHFLMPNEGFKKEWKEAAGLHWIDRVLKVKRIFHVSYKTVLMRLIENGMVDKSIWIKFNHEYQLRFNRVLNFKEEPAGIDSAEPYRLQQFDFYEDRLSRLVRTAVEKDTISLSRGAEILHISIKEMQGLQNSWEAGL